MTLITTPHGSGPALNLPFTDDPLSLASSTPLGTVGQQIGWVRDLVAATLALNQQSTDDGVVDDNGAPALPLPLNDFSGDQLALILAAIDTRMKDSQAKTAKEGIEAARARTESANKEIQSKLKDAIDEQKDAEGKEKQQKIWGWIGKIAAVIGAVVAVITTAAAAVVTGAAAAPLLALAVVGLVAATVDLASAINQEIYPDAAAFTLGSLIGDAIIGAMDKAGMGGEQRAGLSGAAAALGFMLMQPDLAGQMAEDSAIADGRSPDFAANLRMGVMIAGVVTTLVAMIVVTIASGGASSSNLANSAAKTGVQAADTASDAATMATKTADMASKATKAVDMAAKINKAAKLIQGSASVVQGSAAIGSAVVSIQTAEDLKAAEEARADAKKLDAVVLGLQAQSEEQLQRLKDIIAALEEGMTQFSQMVAAAGDQRANQIRNLVRA